MNIKKEDVGLCGFETYGTQNPINKAHRQLKELFTINPYADALYNRKGLKCYIPGINKARLILSLCIAVGCIVVPIITPLSVPVLMWGLK